MSTDHLTSTGEKPITGQSPEYNAVRPEGGFGDLPDTQNQRATEILGARVPIQEVGSSNFRLPMKVRLEDGSLFTVEVAVFGGVSLSADRKGINMSRIMRVFYEFKEEVVSFSLIRRILEAYLDRLDADSGRLRLSFSLPSLQKSLRSGLEGYQYYDCVLEGRLCANGDFRRMLQIGFIYSSACPCSSDLSEHAREQRGVYSIPHSQRSRARVRVVPTGDESVDIFGLVGLCRDALATETQVMVRRSDEQAFAELNGAYQKFVEDAVRLFYAALDEHEGIRAFAVSCSHLESLHSHDAVATVAKGLPLESTGGMDDYGELVC